MIRNSFLSGLKSLIFILVVFLFEACSSQYHWVKVNSQDPQKINKKDSVSLHALNGINSQDSAGFSADHGMISVKNRNLIEKAFEFKRAHSPEKLAALHSKDFKVKNQAIMETLHEQLVKNTVYSQLSYSRQNKIEAKIAKSISTKAQGLDLSGINNLVILGVLLLLGSILFFIFPSIAFIGVLIDVVAAVLIILGLVQMLG